MAAACNFRPQCRRLAGINARKPVSGILCKKAREPAGRVTRARAREPAYSLDRGADVSERATRVSSGTAPRALAARQVVSREAPT